MVLSFKLLFCHTNKSVVCRTMLQYDSCCHTSEPENDYTSDEIQNPEVSVDCWSTKASQASQKTQTTYSNEGSPIYKFEPQLPTIQSLKELKTKFHESLSEMNNFINSSKKKLREKRKLFCSYKK